MLGWFSKVQMGIILLPLICICWLSVLESELHPQFVRILNELIKQYTHDLNSKALVDRLQMSFQCCGVQTSDEFPQLLANRSELFSNSHNDVFPFSCCDPAVKHPCFTNKVPHYSSFYTTGCADELTALFVSHLDVQIRLWIGTFFWIFAQICLFRLFLTSLCTSIFARGDVTCKAPGWLFGRKPLCLESNVAYLNKSMASSTSETSTRSQLSKSKSGSGRSKKKLQTNIFTLLNEDLDMEHSPIKHDDGGGGDGSPPNKSLEDSDTSPESSKQEQAPDQQQRHEAAAEQTAPVRQSSRLTEDLAQVSLDEREPEIIRKSKPSSLVKIRESRYANVRRPEAIDSKRQLVARNAGQAAAQIIKQSVILDTKKKLNKPSQSLSNELIELTTDSKLDHNQQQLDYSEDAFRKQQTTKVSLTSDKVMKSRTRRRDKDDDDEADEAEETDEKSDSPKSKQKVTKRKDVNKHRHCCCCNQNRHGKSTTDHHIQALCCDTRHRALNSESICRLDTWSQPGPSDSARSWQKSPDLSYRNSIESMPASQRKDRRRTRQSKHRSPSPSCHVDHSSLFEDGPNYGSIILPVNTKTQRLPSVKHLLTNPDVCDHCKHQLKSGTSSPTTQRDHSSTDDQSSLNDSGSPRFNCFMNHSGSGKSQILVAALSDDARLEMMRQKAEKKELKHIKKQQQLKEDEKKEKVNKVRKPEAGGSQMPDGSHQPSDAAHASVKRHYKERYFILKEIR